MSIIDSLFGQGAIDSTFSDWSEARNFVIFQTIMNNPRFDDATNIALQDMEEQAYEATSGQLLKTEKQEIGEYFNYLRNNFPSITDDERFLAIYDSAVEVKAGESSVGLDDVEIPKKVSIGLPVLIGLGLGLFLVIRD
ncbi:MAG: hypothetical protein CL525_14335 [Aequorivita sp.]|nr:hypothetical protein [Aequorivita sp.]